MCVTVLFISSGSLSTFYSSVSFCIVFFVEIYLKIFMVLAEGMSVSIEEEPSLEK